MLVNWIIKMNREETKSTSSYFTWLGTKSSGWIWFALAGWLPITTFDLLHCSLAWLSPDWLLQPLMDTVRAENMEQLLNCSFKGNSRGQNFAQSCTFQPNHLSFSITLSNWALQKAGKTFPLRFWAAHKGSTDLVAGALRFKPPSSPVLPCLSPSDWSAPSSDLSCDASKCIH